MSFSQGSTSMTGSAQTSSQGPSNSRGLGKDDMLDDKSFTAGVMGIMYTVSKEKPVYTKAFICFRLLVDWLQLFLLIVQPGTFDIPAHQLWWRILSFISLNQFFSIRGYTFFIVCFYASVAGLILAVVLSVWVGHSFRENRFDFVWPIAVLRWFSAIFLQILDISTLSIFLMALDCQFFGRADSVTGYNQEFPDVYCWSMPHVIHAIVGVVSITLFVILAAVASVGEMEMDFRTKNSLAQMHTETELQTLVIRVLMTFVAVVVYSPKWQSVTLFLLAARLTFLMWYWQPQLVGWVNHVRVGAYFSVTWVALLYVVLAFNIGWDADKPGEVSDAISQMTVVMWVTTVPMGCLGGLLSWLRLRWFTITLLNQFRQNRIVTKLAYQFDDSRFVEILARCCRVWVDVNDLDPDAVLLAEVVLKVGLAQLPKDPFMVILYSSFLMDVQNSYQSGYTQLQHAKKLDAGFLMRFAIFIREQQHAQRSAAEAAGKGDSADLLSYVEFQRNYGLALGGHTAALDMMQRFWQLMMHGNASFKVMSETVTMMDLAIKQADRVYKQVLEHHSGHVKMVRLYAKFLEHVRQDPWSAAHWFGEAERLEAIEEEVKNHDTLDSLELQDPLIRAALQNAGQIGGESSGHSRGIVIVNAQSMIQITNQVALDMLGYAKGELKDRKLSVILPPQVAEVHASYVKSYIRTGRETALNRTTKQVVLHKEGRLVPIKLTLLKITGSGEDMMFLGIMTEIVPTPGTATMWVTSEGNIMGVCKTCEDWLAHGRELGGSKLSTLVVEGQEPLNLALKAAQAVLQADSQARLMTKDGGGLGNNASVHRGNRALQTRQSREMTTSGGPKESQTSAKVGMFKHSAASRLPSFARSALQGAPDYTDEGAQWDAGRVTMAHKYADSTKLDISVCNVGLGSFTFHALTLTRPNTLLDTGLVALPSLPGAPSVAQSTREHLSSHSQDDVLKLAPSWDPHRKPIPALGANTIASPTAGMIQALFGTRKPKKAISLLAPISQDLLLVASPNGQIIYITGKLAEKLGRTRAQLAGTAVNGAIEQVMMEPFGQLHRNLLSARCPLVPPAFSCRLGLPVLLQAITAQGRQQPVPFRLSVRKHRPPGASGDGLHVVQLEEQSLEQALDHRRMLLEVDLYGLITQQLSTTTAAMLFDLESESLEGQHIGGLVDILQQDIRTTPTAHRRSIDEACTPLESTVLIELITLAMQFPDVSWRVGVCVGQPASSNGPNSARTPIPPPSIPAVMRIRPLPGFDLRQSETVLVELWRADLATSIIQLDSHGNVADLEFNEMATLYPPGLLLGASMHHMLDQHISNFLPAMAGRPVADLFMAGVLGPEPERAIKSYKLPGNLKGRRGAAAAPPVGAQQLITVTHASDGLDINLCLQAVRKTGGASSGAVFLILHAMQPVTGRSDFWSFINSSSSRELPITSALPVTQKRGLSRNTSRGPAKQASFINMMPTPPALNTFTAPMIGVRAKKLSTSFAKRGDESDASAEDEKANESLAKIQEGSSRALLQSGKYMEYNGADAPEDGSDLVIGAHGEVVRALDGGRASPFGPADGNKAHLKMAFDVSPAAPHQSAFQVQTKGPSFRMYGNKAFEGQDDDEEDEDDEDEEPSEKEEEERDDESTMQPAVTTNDFQRGKTVKKLYRLIGSAQVQEPQNNFHKRALIIVGLICLVQLGTYIAMHMLLGTLSAVVNDLMNIGRAGVLSTDIATWTRTINMIYANMEVPTLRLMSAKNDLPYLEKIYLDSIAEFSQLHQGIYLGFGQQRRLPDAYGLRDLWENDILPLTVTAQIQYNQSLGNFTVMDYYNGTTYQSLWEAGNTFAQKAASFAQNADAFNRTLNGNLSAFADFPDLVWIVTNAPAAIFPGYLTTLDAYLQVVLQKLNSINSIQLLICLAETFAVCGGLSIGMWIMLQQVADRRLSIYSMFLVIPNAIIKKLATKAHNLGDDEAGQENDRDEDPLKNAQVMNQAGPTPVKFADKAERKKDKDKLKVQDKEDETMSIHVWGCVPLALLARFFPKYEKLLSERLENRRRKRLKKDYRTSVVLVSPVLAWGVIILVCNAVGFALLQNVSAPLSLFNMVNYVQVLYNRNNFWLQELTYEPDSSKMDMHRADSTKRVAELRKEYTVMLYGNQVVPNETSFHFQSVKKGVTKAGTAGTDILFKNEQCLCLNATECQATDTHLYPHTVHGLDRMMLKYLEIGNYIEQFQYLDPYLNGPEYDFYWNTVPDMKGGFQRLTEAYQDFVNVSIKSVVNLHTIALILTLLLALAYVFLMLRPFSATTYNETKRIAELLGQLPAEVDVMSVVDRTLLKDMGISSSEPAAPPTKIVSHKSSVSASTMDKGEK